MQPNCVYFALSSPKPADDGEYICEATNAGGVIRSAPLSVRIVDFSIVNQPESQVAVAGESVTLSVEAGGLGPLTYQWYKGPADALVLLAGKTGPTLNFPAAALADSGRYSVRVSNPNSSILSNGVILDVVPLIVDLQPMSILANEGGPAEFEVEAAGQGLSYQWYFRLPGGAATLIPGATTASLRLEGLSRFSGGYYSVTLKNAAGVVSSDEAKLIIQPAAGGARLFLETWDTVVLGPNVEEGITTGSGGLLEGVWSPVAPAGWTIDNTAMPQPLAANVSGTDGVKEWFGWSFAKPQWWAQTAGDQGRTGFASGVGDPENTGLPSIVAVADPDEWDDLAHSAGRFVSSLTSPEVDISTAAPGSVVLAFDSSWQMEAPQKAKVEVSIDNGAYQEIMLWSAEGADAHPDAVDEKVLIAVHNTQGSRRLRMRFTLFDAGNNWWWAIDNIEVTASIAGVPVAPLVMTSVALDPTTHVAGFRWQSITGRSYTLQYSLKMKLWYPAQTGLIGGPGTETQASLGLDVLFPGGFLPASVFFRIKE